jgi:hypothetical protein
MALLRRCSSHGVVVAFVVERFKAGDVGGDRPVHGGGGPEEVPDRDRAVPVDEQDAPGFCCHVQVPRELPEPVVQPPAQAEARPDQQRGRGRIVPQGPAAARASRCHFRYRRIHDGRRRCRRRSLPSKGSL